MKMEMNTVKTTPEKIKELATALLNVLRENQKEKADFEIAFGAVGLLLMHLAGSLDMSKEEFNTLTKDLSDHYGGPRSER
jgi:hypothetical protein